MKARFLRNAKQKHGASDFMYLKPKKRQFVYENFINKDSHYPSPFFSEDGKYRDGDVR
jgi:hypothetical protein